MMNDDATLIPTQEALLPCPFCGKAPTSQFYGDEDGGYWGIDCPRHHAVAHEDDEQEAITAWNTRINALASQPPALDEQGAREFLVRYVKGEDRKQFLLEGGWCINLDLREVLNAILAASRQYRGGDAVAMREAAAKAAYESIREASLGLAERAAAAIRTLPASPLHASAPVEERARELLALAQRLHALAHGAPRSEDGCTALNASAKLLIARAAEAITAALALPDGVREALAELIEEVQCARDDVAGLSLQKQLSLEGAGYSKRAMVELYDKILAALSPVRDGEGGEGL